MEVDQNKIFTDKEKKQLNVGKWGVIVSIIALTSFYFFNFYATTVLTQESSAQFGDYFGGVLNPILGFATVSLLVWSIQIQLRELKFTRDELELNTQANREQAIELKRQNDFLIRKENENSLHFEFDMYQKLFLEQQSVLNELLSKPLGFEVKGCYITVSDLIYIKNKNYQSRFDEHTSDNITHMNFAKHQVAHTLNQCEWILDKMLTRFSLPGSVNAIKINIDWLFPFISIFYEKRLISGERARDMYALMKQSINNSDFNDIDKNVLKERLNIHISPSII